jgi:hypothetical protein
MVPTFVLFARHVPYCSKVCGFPRLFDGLTVLLEARCQGGNVLEPDRTLKLDFLNTRNIIILALSVFVFKFVHLATIVLVPVGGGLLSTDDAAP